MKIISTPGILGLANFYRNRRVLVTGHTGFKGSWLCEWLLLLGADVTGFSLEPDTDPSLFRQLGLADRLRHHIGDVRDAGAVATLFQQSRPEVVFHLAAQPLVRQSYTDPLRTHEVNFMGTVRLLEALRVTDRPCAAVMVTSDKCYENTGSLQGYREDDRLGGHDPYSSSKACAELVVSSYRRSFFGGGKAHCGPVRLASARAGNVIGGGDWASDRIVPDCIRSLFKQQAILVRNRHAVRPWQHVLEPLYGYLLLGSRIHPESNHGSIELHHELDTFNFGPSHTSERPVKDLVEELLLHWPGTWSDHSPEFAPHEASLLTLDASKANRLLGWQPIWDFTKTVRQTACWYRSASESDGLSPAAMTRSQIQAYMNDACASQSAPPSPRLTSDHRMNHQPVTPR
jgi:CDP-glucose 4,6-dehydratase